MKFSVNFTWFFINTSNWRINFCLIFSVNLTLFYNYECFKLTNFSGTPYGFSSCDLSRFPLEKSRGEIVRWALQYTWGVCIGGCGTFSWNEEQYGLKKMIFFAKYKFWWFFPSIWPGFAKFCLKMLFACFFRQFLKFDMNVSI